MTNLVENNHHRLADGKFLVEGVRRAALYDTVDGNVYSLNQEAADVIKRRDNNQEFWLRLSSMGLALTQQNFKSPPESTATETEIPKPSLQFAWLEITDQCNERCLHCYGSFSPGKKDKVAEPLRFNEWKRVINSLAINDCSELQFIGGEPFMFRGESRTQTVIDLAEYAKTVGVDFIEIFTNGTMMPQESIKRIKDIGAQIALSIYSSDPGIHDSITQSPGSFKKTLKTVNALLEADIPVRASLIIMKQNEDTVEQTLEMIKKLGLNIRPPDVVRPSGRAQEINIAPDIKTLLKYGLVTEPNFSTDQVSFHRNHLYNPCLAGKIAITTDGKVIPCIFSRNETLGNIKDQELEQILQSTELKNTWQLTKDNVLVCKDCEYRYACFDCRPLAADSSCGRNYTNAPSPRCTYNPYSGEWGSGIWRMNNHGEVIYDKLPIQINKGKGGETP